MKPTKKIMTLKMLPKATVYIAPTVPEFLAVRFRLLLFGGKGGVGKTTCASATALYLAQNNPDQSFLLISTDPAHSLADCFGNSPAISNLILNEINPKEYAANFKTHFGIHLKTIAMRGTFLDQTDISSLLDLSLPGLDEIVALLEISDWAHQGKYSSIIVDTAPAGHTLRLLELPEILHRWLDALDTMSAKHRYMMQLYRGAYTKDAADLFLKETAERLTRLEKLLRNTERCRFVPVMLPEELSIYITRTLIAGLRKLRIPINEIIINRLAPPVSDTACRVCVAREASQAVAIKTLRRAFADFTLWGLPYFMEEVRGTERLSDVWVHVSRQNARNGNNDQQQPAAPAPVIDMQAVDNPALLPQHSLKLLLFAGKGGVGKTTLACASALRLAEARKGEILLFSIDPAHSLSACLRQKIGDTPVRIAKGLSAVEMDAEAEFGKWKQNYITEMENAFKSPGDQSGVDIVFDRDVMERVSDLAPPGLDEILALMRIVELMESGAYDLFVLDTAPTGHLLRFLEMPELVESWLRVFFGILLKYREVLHLPKLAQDMVTLSKQIKDFRRILTDPAQTALMLVTIPSMLAYEETQDLAAACYRLRMAIPVLFVNRVTPPSSCPTCSALRSGEQVVRRRYESIFADRHIVQIFQQTGYQGIERLIPLGRALYLP
jgi:arsenite-transporting ATPase